MYKVMTPGPTQVRENVRNARSLPCTNPDIDESFVEFYSETCKLISSLAYKEVRERLGAKNDRIKVYSDAEMKEYGFGGMLAHFSWCRLLDDYTPGSAMDWMVRMF